MDSTAVSPSDNRGKKIIQQPSDGQFSKVTNFAANREALSSNTIVKIL